MPPGIPARRFLPGGRRELSGHCEQPVTVFPDWREPVARLRVEHGRPTEEQRQLAAQVGLTLRADEPRPIVAAKLRDALADPLELRPFEPASERQFK